jgi:hypothetical protein
MKNLLKFLSLIVLVNFSFTGCYTIIWDPTEDVAPSGNYDEESEFYEPGYFGGYGGFYESPWWVSNPVFIINTGGSDSPKTKDRTNGRDNGTGEFRNDGGRGNNDRNPGSNDGSSGNIINTPPPTRDSGSGNTSNSGSYNSNSNSNSSSGNETRSSGTNNTRNNSGTRNSGSGRR